MNQTICRSTVDIGDLRFCKSICTWSSQSNGWCALHMCQWCFCSRPRVGRSEAMKHLLRPGQSIIIVLVSWCKCWRGREEQEPWIVEMISIFTFCWWRNLGKPVDMESVGTLTTSAGSGPPTVSQLEVTLNHFDVYHLAVSPSHYGRSED